MLAGTAVAITGGGSGLGRALVSHFLDQGARVAVLEFDRDKAERLRAEVPQVCVVEGDARTCEANAELATQATSVFGGLDCLIANAGIWDFNEAFADTEPSALDASFNEVFAINVKAAMLGARACLAPLRRARGSMIFTLSNASFYPGGGGALYTASKHALVGLIRQLAYELAPDVRVNGVAPGVLPSDIRGPQGLGQDQRSIADALPRGEGLKRYTLMEHEVSAQSYVGAYSYLANSALSPTATGTFVDLSGVGVRGRKDRELARRIAQGETS